MLILILIGVQYSGKAAFSFEKGVRSDFDNLNLLTIWEVTLIIWTFFKANTQKHSQAKIN